MSYPGDPSLTPDVKSRILETFQQTLELAHEGKLHEARLGCDFVLSLDSRFSLARRLQGRLDEATGPVEVADLLAALPDDEPSLEGPVAEQPTEALPPQSPAEEPWEPAAPREEDETYLLGDEEVFEEVDDLDFEEAPSPPSELVGDERLAAELQHLLHQRDFEGLLRRAQEEEAAVSTDDGLRRIVQTGRERMEAEPYIGGFLAAALQAVETGDDEKVDTLLEKVRALDPTHPGVAEVMKARAQAPPSASEPTSADGSTTAEAAAPSLPPAPPSEAPTEEERDPRIAELLREGQAAFGREEYQAAIDAWSRIFLIDIDHSEASRRIEEARRLKAEGERKLEELFHEGVSKLDAGDAEEAERCFRQVLEIQPNHLAAREYLDELEAGTVPDVRAADAAALAGVAGAEAPLKLPVEEVEEVAELKEEILVPPAPGEARPPAAPIPAVRAAKARGRLFLYVGAGVLALVVAGVWLVLTRWDSLFPNSQGEQVVVAPEPTPIERATKLHAEGKEAIAISQLKRLPPDDPYYEEAQALLAEWEARQEPEEQLLPAEEAARYEELLARAREAYSNQAFMATVELLNEAEVIAPLQEADKELDRDARIKIVPLLDQIDFIKQGEYELALPGLWRMHEEDPDNRDVPRLMVTAYHNMGVRNLQRGKIMEAQEMFQEALSLQPEDPELKRLQSLAETYVERGEDLLLRIFVKYLPFRPV